MVGWVVDDGLEKCWATVTAWVVMVAKSVFGIVAEVRVAVITDEQNRRLIQQRMVEVEWRRGKDAANKQGKS